jgi:RNA polymerase sigma-70 factor (ECF subfamily)
LEFTTPDELLMARIARGDISAFEVLVRRHQASVLNLVFRFLGDPALAEDVAQETFLRVWKAAKSYEPRAKFTTWMYRIVANLCLNELKSPWRKKVVSFHRVGSDGAGSGDERGGDLPDDRPSPEDVLLDKERGRRVTQALQGLPTNQRLALILKRYEGLSYQEIAKVLGCSVSAVESLLVRGKRNLQDKLGRQGK